MDPYVCIYEQEIGDLYIYDNELQFKFLKNPKLVKLSWNEIEEIKPIASCISGNEILVKEKCTHKIHKFGNIIDLNEVFEEMKKPWIHCSDDRVKLGSNVEEAEAVKRVIKNKFNDINFEEDQVHQRWYSSCTVPVEGRSITTMKIAITRQLRMGSIESASAVATFLLAFPNLKLLMMSGICAGIDEEREKNLMKLGDIVVAEEVFDYATGSKIASNAEVRHHLPTLVPDQQMVIWAKDQQNNFKNCLINQNEIPNILSGDVACGPYVREDLITYYKTLKVSKRKTKAFDMESFGLLQAAVNYACKTFIAKAVSDFGTNEKNDAAHTLAAEASASLVLHVILKYPF